MFSWDARKALKNYEKHGVPFEEAATIFSDPDGLEWEDFSTGEPNADGRDSDGQVTAAFFLLFTL